MVDVVRVMRLLKDIVDALDVLEGEVRRPLEEFVRDKRSVFAVRHAIVVIVEAAAQIGVHILEEIGSLPESYREIFILLAKHGVISEETGAAMARLAGLRNLIVHRYWTIDDARIREEALKGGVEAIRRFVEEVKRYVERQHSVP